MMSTMESNYLIRLIRLYHSKLVQIERLKPDDFSLRKRVLCEEASALDQAIRCRISA